MEIKYFDEKGQILEDLFSEKAEEIVKELIKKRDDKECNDFKFEFKFNKDLNKKLLHYQCNNGEWDVNCPRNKRRVKKNLSYSQIRKFYDEVLNFKAMLDNGKSFREILPYFKMLKAKANVAFERDVINCNFKEFIDKNVDYVTKPKNIEEKEKRFNVFVTFFEAVVAYSKGKIN